MTSSMTGFARRGRELPLGILSCEIRTVNHRYLELSVRLPEPLRDQEMAVRERLSNGLKRGKIDCTVRLEPRPGDPSLTLNQPLVLALVQAAAQLQAHAGVGPLRAVDLLRWPNVLLDIAQPEVLAPEALQLVGETVQELTSQRQREGARLRAFLHARIEDMLFQVAAARALMPSLVPEFRERLRQRLRDLPAGADPGRIEQEIILFAQRADVSEEVDRLSAHLDEVERLIGAAGPVGRKLDFMMQELNREANTLGSKASDLRLTAVAVELKLLIEQMREQVQNIE